MTDIFEAVVPETRPGVTEVVWSNAISEWKRSFDSLVVAFRFAIEDGDEEMIEGIRAYSTGQLALSAAVVNETYEEARLQEEDNG